MKKNRQIFVGNIAVGGGAPVSVQSMCNTDTRDVKATLKQISELADAGCQIIRVAVPDKPALEAFGKIVLNSVIPVIADIHFDNQLAIAAIEAGAHGIRINPGNIGSQSKVREIAQSAKKHNISIRVGVNSGSLEKDIRKEYAGVTPEGLVKSALRHCAFLEKIGFSDIKVSLKSSNVLDTFKAYSLFSEKSDYPLHLGITEAGTIFNGTVKSAVGIGALLLNGIGDTIRVSLTADPILEVKTAIKILEAAGLRTPQFEIISCPTCGRTKIDIIKLADELENRLATIDFGEKTLKIAVMGCAVNGPGEAREADYGIAGGVDSGVLFLHGRVIENVPQDKLIDRLILEINKDL
ncbi:MAG: flavodoxin-dependent (E)-4-hydroxy-3-methylbut-2-enyl-diphosphate synthase [Verrucomicrobiota bacterium]|nr:flavodoxin-dependent (E)-4-hydroxy-3-methylbut-2-enyl-diphosphate synthase [Verrucomicrobiota bacterium]